jgi:glyoxylase-like metal-dependent hydrolase (beta-lactamase superfamily II)
MKIKTIRLSLPLRMGIVNCYLLDTGESFFLIDSGGKNQRAFVEKELENAGCRPGSLKLILLTHGDFDHSSNAAYLRRNFGVPVAIHTEDALPVEQGDMFANRTAPVNLLVRKLTPILFGIGQAERFTPDVLLNDGDDLACHGLAARVLHLPGHSKGSCGVLTSEGDLFCGDLFDNLKAPALTTLVDDPTALRASFERVKAMPIRRIYPGHGEPFTLDQLK